MKYSNVYSMLAYFPITCYEAVRLRQGHAVSVDRARKLELLHDTEFIGVPYPHHLVHGAGREDTVVMDVPLHHGYGMRLMFRADSTCMWYI